MLLFSVVSMLFTYAVLRLQGLLPLNPQGYGAAQMPADLVFNTAASFTSNTSWATTRPSDALVLLQHGRPGHPQLGLGGRWHGRRHRGDPRLRAAQRGRPGTSGPMWSGARLTAASALIGALIYVAMGVPQNFDPATVATTLEGGKQTIWQGPVASQEIIKQLV